MKIGCALIGSLGALYNGVLLANLVIALFALVAIESSSQSLGRTYAALLICAILLDISWFILFAHEIWYPLLFSFIEWFTDAYVLWSICLILVIHSYVVSHAYLVQLKFPYCYYMIFLFVHIKCKSNILFFQWIVKVSSDEGFLKYSI